MPVNSIVVFLLLAAAIYLGYRSTVRGQVRDQLPDEPVEGQAIEAGEEHTAPEQPLDGTEPEARATEEPSFETFTTENLPPDDIPDELSSDGSSAAVIPAEHLVVRSETLYIPSTIIPLSATSTLPQTLAKIGLEVEEPEKAEVKEETIAVSVDKTSDSNTPGRNEPSPAKEKKKAKVKTRGVPRLTT